MEASPTSRMYSAALRSRSALTKTSTSGHSSACTPRRCVLSSRPGHPTRKRRTRSPGHRPSGPLTIASGNALCRYSRVTWSCGGKLIDRPRRALASSRAQLSTDGRRAGERTRPHTSTSRARDGPRGPAPPWQQVRGTIGPSVRAHASPLPRPSSRTSRERPRPAAWRRSRGTRVGWESCRDSTAPRGA